MFPRAPEALPLLTAEQMREMDRQLVDEIGLPLIAMMENAGRHLAQATRQLHPEARTVTILAGKGGNGGGGLVAARHLANAGLEVTVHLATPTHRLSEATGTQARILASSGIEPIVEQTPGTSPDLTIDALLGYSQTGQPRGEIGTLVSWAEATQAPSISLDVPTGVDPDTGALAEARITPEATVTLALPKRGLVEAPSKAIGRRLLADIGVPMVVYQRFEAPVPVFRNGPILAF